MRLIKLNLLLFIVFFMFSGCGKESTKIEISTDKKETTQKEEASKNEEIQYLMVQNAKDVKLTPTSLTLVGVSPTTIFFSDRPKRIVGHVDNQEVVSVWTEGSDKLSSDPPNATLSILGEKEMVDLVVELTNPRSEGENFAYDMKILDGEIPEFTGPSTLFIDPVGMPRTPGSVGGVARRTTRRVAIR